MIASRLPQGSLLAAVQYSAVVIRFVVYLRLSCDKREASCSRDSLATFVKQTRELFGSSRSPTSCDIVRQLCGNLEVCDLQTSPGNCKENEHVRTKLGQPCDLAIGKASVSLSHETQQNVVVHYRPRICPANFAFYVRFQRIVRALSLNCVWNANQRISKLMNIH